MEVLYYQKPLNILPLCDRELLKCLQTKNSFPSFALHIYCFSEEQVPCDVTCFKYTNMLKLLDVLIV
jgi:hypothetical protein